MKKFELDIVEFDNEDVIATSGATCQHQNDMHFYATSETGGSPSEIFGNEWIKNGSSWSMEERDGTPSHEGIYSIFFDTNPVQMDTWYYYDEGTGLYKKCDADHGYIHE